MLNRFEFFREFALYCVLNLDWGWKWEEGIFTEGFLSFESEWILNVDLILLYLW